jgi:hypothetical protein
LNTPFLAHGGDFVARWKTLSDAQVIHLIETVTPVLNWGPQTLWEEGDPLRRKANQPYRQVSLLALCLSRATPAAYEALLRQVPLAVHPTAWQQASDTAVRDLIPKVVSDPQDTYATHNIAIDSHASSALTHAWKTWWATESQSSAWAIAAVDRLDRTLAHVTPDGWLPGDSLPLRHMAIAQAYWLPEVKHLPERQRKSVPARAAALAQACQDGLMHTTNQLAALCPEATVDFWNTKATSPYGSDTGARVRWTDIPEKEVALPDIGGWLEVITRARSVPAAAHFLPHLPPQDPVLGRWLYAALAHSDTPLAEHLWRTTAVRTLPHPRTSTPWEAVLGAAPEHWGAHVPPGAHDWAASQGQKLAIEAHRPPSPAPPSLRRRSFHAS